MVSSTWLPWQPVLADNIGLALAVAATGWTGKVANARLRLALPLLAFVPLAAVDLFCIYKELKSVQLRTINKERGEIIAEGFIQRGRVPSLKAVADAERLFIPARMDESSLPLKITRLGEACPTPEALVSALGDVPSRPYVLTYLPYTGGGSAKASWNPLRRRFAMPREPMTATAVPTDERPTSGAVLGLGAEGGAARDVIGAGDGAASTETGTGTATMGMTRTGVTSGTVAGAAEDEPGTAAAPPPRWETTPRSPPGGGGSGKRKGPGLKGSAFLALGQHATSRDIMQAVLQVAHLRHLPFRRDLDADSARRW